ncbi:MULTISPECIES: response regulator [Streptomyces]|uniref:Transcriptional regulatory protein n=2 Tax=Streptomyces TaxID=1883 RepID=A0A3M8F106_9ACTN|nr:MULTISPECIES: response regulator [Streptomyces]KNE79784.1 chemotaxis protein CheY [Streptomyces fradiae]OFA37786.1 two-component system response regulator [Streptomyces fradiae]PQM21832.1 two-component system response regulator [Streptomyces xinghaiensis]RKM93264.1 response regulator [Streptomyces xinghaiensis]RNC71138.1 response regulator [Streptomyces xinghaiensis]
MIRVLVVDDDFMVARLHGRQVEQLSGFTVVGEARSGAEALAAVRELRPDLVLLDIYLPDMGGLDVLRALRQGGSPGSETDVLVVTAARDAETVRGALRGGAVHYIIKPFEAGVLHERLLHYARRNRELRTFTAPGQDDVDRVFAVGPAAPATAPATGPAPPGAAPAAVPAAGTTRPVAGAARLPKGVTEQTAALVREAVTDAGDGLSASECAALTGLSRVSARRYLEYFVTAGHAEVRLRYGTAGRPERRYHWL